MKYNNNGIICFVCLTELEDDEAVKTLSCGDKFHKDCARNWLKFQNTCPTCQVKVIESQ